MLVIAMIIGTFAASPSAFTATERCSNPPATVRITAFFLTGDPHDPYRRAGDGVHIRLGKSTLGVTDAEGQVSIELPVGDHELVAIDPAFAIGRTRVSVASSDHIELQFNLDPDKPRTLDADFAIEESDGDVLPANFDAFTIGTPHFSNALTIQRIDRVLLLPSRTGRLLVLTDNFKIDDGGKIAAIDTESLRGLLQSRSEEKISLDIQVVDTDNLTYEGTADFHLGTSHLQIEVVGPPSKPDLNTAGMDLTIEWLGEGLLKQLTTDRRGQATVSWIPSGTIYVKGTVHDDGIYYNVNAMVALSGNQTLQAKALTTEDILNEVPGWSVD